MSDSHVDPDRLLALRLGTLPGEEARALLNHVATCALCQRAAQESLNVRADAREVVRGLSAESQGVDATNQTDGATPLSYESHPHHPASDRWVALAAVLAGIAVATPALLWQRQAPAPVRTAPPVVRHTSPEPAPSDPVPSPVPEPRRSAPWEALVRETLTGGALQAPAVLLSLQPEPDQFRARETGTADLPDLRPFAEMLETDRPSFRWPETAGATYTVLVGERGRIVTQSGPLTSNRWRCDAALPRGRTYTWQVEVRTGDATVLLPTPPAPPVRFHLLDRETKAQLDDARRQAPDDHLLLAILYARAGLRDAALQELDAVQGDDATHARTLGDTIRNWPIVRR